MRFVETPLAGAFSIELEPHADARGFFARTFCEREFREHGIVTRFPQCNLSRNEHTGTLRGMHYEQLPTEESKLVRCASGAVHDVIVDLRRGSPTRFRSFGVELTAEKGNALFVPAGFAHGFITLAPHTDVFYHMGDFFRADAGRGARWNEPLFGITWPREPVVMSERDRTYPDLDPRTLDG